MEAHMVRCHLFMSAEALQTLSIYVALFYLPQDVRSAVESCTIMDVILQAAALLS